MIRTNKLVAAVVGLTMVLSLVGGVSIASAQSMSLADLVNLFIGLGIISADKADAARAAAGITGTTPTTSYTFTSDLTVGSRGAGVTALQNLLGVSPATGHFGALTKAAVIKYQLAKGISPAAGYVGAKTRAVLNASVTTTTTTTTTTTVPAGTSLNVSLAPTSPSASAVVAGQAIADLAEYTFTNTSATPAVITNVTLQRGGVSNDAALLNVYLYNGVNRLTDSATVSSGKISFNAPAGLFTIPAGSSMTVAIRADILSGTTYNGQMLVISLTGVSANVPVSASYPISGALQTISSATIATVAVASSSPSTTSIDPQNDYVMWQGTANVSNNDIWMKAIALRQIGSVSAGDLANFRFYLDGVQIGSTLASYDGNGYLTFDLSSNPVKLTTGNHIIKMIGDVIGGSTKNFSFSLRQASDINVVDSQLNVNVLSTAAATFPLTSGVQSVLAGSLTITKKTDSPSGNVTLQSSSQTLARFEVKAAGEPIKIESLDVKWTGSNRGNIRNGALFANGSQIGSTADIASSTAATAYTRYNLGSSLIVYPGSPVIVEVRGDIYSSSGTQWANADTFTISLVAGSSNANLQKSLGYVSTSAVSANQLTVSQGSLSLTKNGSYANQSIIAPQTAAKLGQYTLTAGTTEDLNLNTIVVNFGTASTTISKVTDVYVVYGSKQTGNKATVVAGDNSYAVNYTLPKGQTIDVTVYGSLASDIGSTDTVITRLSIVGQTVLSTQTVTIPTSSYTAGQTVSITTGNLNLAVYSLPADINVVAGNLVKAGSFQFVATGDTFTVDQLSGFVPYAAAGNVASVVYKIGNTVLNGAGTTIDTSDDSTAYATTTGLNIVVPANSSTGVIVDAYLNLASINTPGGATSSSNVKFTLNGYRKMSSTGVQTLVGGTAKAGNNQYAYASIPTITNVELPETGATSLSAGTKTIARVKIAADASGAIDWSEINWTVTKPAAVSLGAVTTDWVVTDDAGNTIGGTIATTTDLATSTGSVTSGNVKFTPTTIETISAGSYKIYKLKTSVGGTIASNDAVTTKIPASGLGNVQSAANSTVVGTDATFIWSDRSFVGTTGHSATTPDWNNDNLVKNLPTDSQSIIN